jgi:hypothetical protein
LIGKTASCAAMALTFAAYVVAPGPWQRPAAAAAVLALTAVNYRGVTRTARLTRVLVAVVLAVLAVVTAVSWAAGNPDPARLGLVDAHGGVYGTLQAAGLLFFAFAGYARIATMGEEVRDPARTIGTLRRECLDHLLITGPRHLDIVLRDYMQHFNAHRPHRSLDQRPPAGGTPSDSGAGLRVLRRDRLGGLLHEYVLSHDVTGFSAPTRRGSGRHHLHRPPAVHLDAADLIERLTGRFGPRRIDQCTDRAHPTGMSVGWIGQGSRSRPVR